MTSLILLCLAWLTISLFAGFLRLSHLETRPVHPDEATGARILAERLQGGDYSFDPSHFHGPLLGVVTEPVARLRGESSWQSLSIETLRLSPVLAGMLLVLTPLLWRREMGDYGAALSGALLACSPLIVYYNRMFIHESWLALFGMLGVAFAYRSFQQPSAKNALLCGISIGCMFATKETFIITVFAWVIGLLLCYALRRYHQSSATPTLVNYLLPAGIVGLSAALIAAFFYSNGFRFPERMLDAVRTYWIYETTPGHDKPSSYYLHLLLWPKHLVGQWWTEGAVLLLAALACIAAVRARSRQLAVVFLAMAAIVQFIVYSSIAYKTPWLMLLPWAQVCLLAGFCLPTIRPTNRMPQVGLACLILAALAFQSQQSLLASQRFENDARAPYVYVPASRDLASLESWLTQLAEAFPQMKVSPVVVIGQGYWPLPWYLRMFNSIGYWQAPEANMLDAPLIFSMEATTPASDAFFAESHTALPRGLRSNLSMTLYLRNDLWTQWITPQP